MDSEGYIGNATMVAARTQSYEFGFNVQVGHNWQQQKHIVVV